MHILYISFLHDINVIHFLRVNTENYCFQGEYDRIIDKFQYCVQGKYGRTTN